MAEVADFSLELGDVELESVFALTGALMQGLILGGPPQGVAQGLAGRGNGARVVLEGGSGGWGGGKIRRRRSIGTQK